MDKQALIDSPQNEQDTDHDIKTPKPDYLTFQQPEKFIEITSDETRNPSLKLATTEAVETYPLRWQILACFMLLLALVGVSIGSAAAQILGGSIPEFELNAWRFGLQLVLLLPINATRRCSLSVPRAQIPLLLVNVVLMNAVNILLFTTYVYLPVGVADGLINSVIITGNAVLSICFKSGRKPTLYVATVICIVGIFIMIQPDFLFGNLNLPPPPETNWTSPCIHSSGIEEYHVTNATSSEISQLPEASIGYVYAISCALAVIIRYHTLSRLVATVNPFNFALWNALLGSVFSLVLMAIFEVPVLPRSGLCVIMLVVHCLGNAMISLGNPWSLQYISPSICAMINTCKMAIMVLFQYTFLSSIKPGLHNWLEILGAVVCFVGMMGGPIVHIIVSAK